MNKFFQLSKAPFFQLFVFYAIAHGGILFIPHAVYWDDWGLFNIRPNIIIETFRQAGSFGNFVGYLHVAMLYMGPWSYKIAVFILNLFTGLFVWQIIGKQNWINRNEKYFITLFFLITPCVAARVAMIDFPYVISVFFFFFAWSVMERYRALSLGLFFLSFITQSLLVFYALPMLDWYCRDLNKPDRNGPIKWCASKIDFLMIPFAWFLVKITFFKPFGHYEGYNESYSLKNLIFSPPQMVFDFLKLNVNLSVTILLCALILFADILPQPKFSSGHRRMLYAGLFALFLGVFPYLIIGVVPVFDDWSSRHQLLMPLGLSLLFVYLIGLSQNNSNRKIFVALFLSVSLFLNLKNYVELFFDWQKQQSLIEFIKSSSAIKASSLVLVDDRTTNALNRKYRFYEWNGLLKWSLGDESHFGIYVSQLKDYDAGDFDGYFDSFYNAATHLRRSDNHRVILTIERNDLKDILFHHSPLYKYLIVEDQKPCLLGSS